MSNRCTERFNVNKKARYCITKERKEEKLEKGLEFARNDGSTVESDRSTIHIGSRSRRKEDASSRDIFRGSNPMERYTLYNQISGRFKSGGHHLRLERSTSDSVAGDTSFSEVVGENSTELMES